MLYLFKKEVFIYTTIEADSEDEAWENLDKVSYSLSDFMEIDEVSCEIIDIKEHEDVY